MPIAKSPANSFTITILEGLLRLTDLGFSETGVIRLSERELPYRPIKYGGSQRVKTTFYPGDPVATQQIIGPTEEPTTINGYWKDRYLGDGRSRQLMEVFETLRRTGARVQVEWGTLIIAGSVSTPGPIVRQGIITKTAFTLDRPQDIQWEVEFTWSGRDEDPAPPVFANSTANPANNFDSAAAAGAAAFSAMENFQRAFAAKTFGFLNKVSGVVDGPLETLSDAVDIINDATNVARTAAALPRNTVGKVVSATTAAADSIRDLRNVLLGPDAQSVLNLALLGLPTLAGRGPEDPLQFLAPNDGAVDALNVQATRLVTVGTLTVSQEQLQSSREAIEAAYFPDVLVEIRVPAGVDLRDIAVRYYNDPDQWWAIAQFNGMSGSLVPPGPSGPSDNPGRPIQIPRQSSGQFSNLRKGGY